MRNKKRMATPTLPTTSEQGNAIEDVLIELFKMFEVEKNAKNEAYHFILSHGHFDAYSEFNRQHQGQNIDHHSECVNYFIKSL